MKISQKNSWLWRPSGAAVVASLALPTVLAGCGSPAQQTQAPMSRNQPMSNNQPMSRNQPMANTGMNTRQKATLLAGAAALYYMYNRYKKQNEARLQGQNVQYYLSKNGQVYYRDPRNPQNVVWVTPPPQQVRSVEVPDAEAGAYSGIQGYNNSQSGKTLRDFFDVR
ncbi:MAG: hypothetical protein KY445_04320 [Armatimonadetes bacterium]|nr:hypothetical protein [Armatimonadota bacterium]